jgi:subtilisin family serine protease
MEKKSTVIAFVLLIMLASIAIPNLTGRITFFQPISAATQFNQAVSVANVATQPGEMIAINDKLSLSPVVLERIEREPTKMQENLMVCFKKTAVDRTIKTITELPAWAKETLPLPQQQTMAVLPFQLAAAPVAVPQTKSETIAIEKTAISTLQKTFTAIPVQNFEVVKNFENFGCSIVRADKEGIQQTFAQGLEVDVYPEEIYKLDGREYDYIKQEKIDGIWRRQAADQYINGKGIKVAIIDSGVDYTHPDLGGCLGQGCKIVGGLNTFAGNQDILPSGDKEGHGTHIAGIVAAIAPNASIVGIKICQEDSCYSTKIAEAIEWCLNESNGCNVATLSLGDQGSYDTTDCEKTGASSGIERALVAAYSRGLVIFASSGNNGPNAPYPAYPACDKNVVSVGSVDLDNKISRFSNLNPNIFALGESVESTWPNNTYHIMYGTSQAAGFAAGVAALYMQSYAIVNKSASALPMPSVIEEAFEATSNSLYDTNIDIYTKQPYLAINITKLIESLIGAEILPSYVCNNSICEWRLGEDSQNCPADCKLVLNFTQIMAQQQGGQAGMQNYSLAFDIKNWEGASTNARIEVRSFLIGIIKDFNYPDAGTDASPIVLPKGNYDLKLSYGSFVAVLESVDINASSKLKIKLEDLTQKIKKIPEFSYAQVKAAYGIGFENNKSSIICFDKQLSGNSTFVLRCPWNGSCKENWSIFMSMKPRETSCISLVPGEGTAFAIVEMPETICGNEICEQGENNETCSYDCGMKPSSAEIVEKEKLPMRFFVLIGAIAVAFILVIIAFKKIRERKAAIEEIPEQAS